MKRLIVGFVAVIALSLPGVASAHSGSVTCDTTGVVFHYNSNFPVATQATEHVGSFTKTFTVPARTAVTDTIPDVTGTIVASSTWSGGGTIPPTTLTCPSVPPVTPTPPVAPPVCPEGTVQEGTSMGVLVCVRTIVTPAPPAPPVFTVCPKGTKNLGIKNGILTCLKTQIKIKVKTKVVTKIKWVQWCPLPPKPTPGVTG